jgi:hypothetical protein
MNKIERAIYDVKLHIAEKERQLLIAQTELKSLKAQLDTLETIQHDKKIPHEIPSLSSVTTPVNS